MLKGVPSSVFTHVPSEGISPAVSRILLIGVG